MNCPRCGDPDGDCLLQDTPEDWRAAMIACRIGMVALQLKRLNDFMDGTTKPPSDAERLRVLCPYCGSDTHLAGSPASDRCRAKIVGNQMLDSLEEDRD